MSYGVLVTNLGDGLLTDPPQVLQIDGRPYFRNWQCPSCGFQVVTPSKTPPSAHVEAQAGDHLADCPA